MEQPKIGDGATIQMYSDRKACTVIAISPSGKTITIQKDKAKLMNGPNSAAPDALTVQPGGFAGHTSGTQRWEYERDPEGPMYKAHLRKDQRFHTRLGPVMFGVRAEHYDHNF